MERNFEIRVIQTENQYLTYLDKVDQLMSEDPSPGSKEGRLMETLAILIEDYERKQGWELPFPDDPVQVIKRRIIDLGLQQKDLITAIGDKTTVSRILKRSRQLTYSMIVPLSDLLGILPQLLLKRQPA